MSDLTIALAGGSVGYVLGAVVGQGARARAAWSEVTLHDEQAADLNRQLVAWVDDRTRELVAELQAVAEEHNRRGTFNSSMHSADLAEAKALALQQYRDQAWRAELDLAAVRASEGPWHRLWRRLRRKPAPTLTADETVQPFLDRWREPVTRHATGEPGAVYDRTRRTLEHALAELPGLSLT